MTSPHAQRQSKPPGQNEHIAKLVLSGVVIVLLVAFILGNNEEVRVSFVFFHSRFSLIWVLLVTNLLGFVAGYLINGRMDARRRRAKAKH